MGVSGCVCMVTWFRYLLPAGVRFQERDGLVPYNSCSIALNASFAIKG